MKYTCNFLFRYKEKEFVDNVHKALTNLGFEPSWMRIFYDEFRKPNAEERGYDDKYFFRVISHEWKPGFIGISDLGNETDGEINSFSINLNIDEDIEYETPLGKTYSLSWSIINNIEFLINSNVFQGFINDENFIYCFCYNSDYMSQEISETKMKVDERGNKSFYSEITHKDKRVADCYFMPAANMWFGRGYIPVFSLDKLRNFKYVKAYNGYNNVVYIELFDLYADPTTEENNAKEREFWKFLSDNHVIDDYEKANKKGGATVWLKMRAEKCKKKKWLKL